MKNLKRILSLALASTMLIGMMVVGASAAEFNDADKIDASYMNAVETMTALKIIKGRDTGDFDPQGNVTRAEMAKMIAVIRNRGVEFNFGTKTNPSFSDIKGHWAEPYIEYCYSMGIINGMGDGTFNPGGKVTATQAARMILNAIGNTEGATGADWALRTEIAARDEINGGGDGLYNNLDEVVINAPLTREQAAQMLTNALNAPIYDENGETGTYTYQEEVKKDIFYIVPKAYDDDNSDATAAVEDTNIVALKNEPFETRIEAILVGQGTTLAKTANGKAVYGTHFTIASTTMGTGTYVTKTAPQSLGSKYLKVYSKTGVIKSVTEDPYGSYTVAGTDSDGFPMSFGYVAENVSGLMGQKVKVLYKGGDTDNVYGIFATGSKVVWEGVVGQITGASNTKKIIKLDGVEYKTTTNSADTPIWNFNSASESDDADAIGTNVKTHYAVKAISNNSKGTIDLFVATPVELGKITSLLTNSITVSTDSTPLNLTRTGSSADVVEYDGIAKGDYVLIAPATYTVSGMNELTEVAAIQGTVDGKTTGKIRVDGTWYSKAANTLANSVDDPALGAKVDLYLVNNYYVYAGLVGGATASKDLLVPVAVAANKTSGLKEYWEAQVMYLPSGEVETVRLTADATEGTLYTYKTEDGYMTLTEADANSSGYAGDLLNTDGWKKATKTLGGNRVADDAVIVVKLKNDKFTFTDGKTAKTWGVDFGSNAKGYVSTVNGIKYVKVAVIEATSSTRLPDAAGTSNLYGYVVSEAYSVVVDKTEYKTFEMWDGAETVTVYAPKDTPAADIDLGSVITYTDLGDGKISGISEITTTGAIVGYNESDSIVSILKGTSTIDANKNITDNTVILYVDNSDPTALKGVPGGEIVLATEDEEEAGKFTKNVTYALNGNDVTIMVIEVNNDWDASVTTDVLTDQVTMTLDYATLEPAASTWTITFTYRGTDWTVADGATEDVVFKMRKGEKITVTATFKGSNDTAGNDKGFDITNNGTPFTDAVEVENEAADATWATGSAHTVKNGIIEINSDTTMKYAAKS